MGIGVGHAGGGIEQEKLNKKIRSIMAERPFPVYVGFDPGEAIAYDVCRHSILSRTREAVDVIPLVQRELRERKLYWRTGDPLASTEFTYTRFLVPALAGYKGWALYCDCDFLWLADIKDLIALADDRFAAMCVHHDHRPTEAMKMDGRVQTLYPRKNWSSLILYNCGHPSNAVLTPELVNRETGSFLHRFAWLKDEAPVPAAYDTVVFAKLKALCRRKDPTWNV